MLFYEMALELLGEENNLILSGIGIVESGKPLNYKYINKRDLMYQYSGE